MKFKTNAKCMGCVTVIRKKLISVAPESAWEFDLNSPDKVMTYVGDKPLSDVDARTVVQLVSAAGFEISRIE